MTRLTHKKFYALAQQCIAFAQHAPIELKLAVGTDTSDAELCEAAIEHFKRGPRAGATMDKDTEVKAPRKNSAEWVLWMIEGGAELQAHRATPVTPWSFDLLVPNRDVTDRVPVTESKIQAMVEGGKLTARFVESKPGCIDTINYTIRKRAA